MSISVDIDVRVTGLVKTQAHLDGIARRAQDFTPVFLWAQDELRRANAKNFSSNGLPVGGWAPLSPPYAAWKAAHGGGPPMQRTGRLFRSLVSLSGPPNTITPMWARFGTEVDYAGFHQYGTRKMPKREVVYEPFGFAADLADRARDHLVHGAIGGDLMFEGLLR